jgi:hypothetical protein
MCGLRALQGAGQRTCLQELLVALRVIVANMLNRHFRAMVRPPEEITICSPCNDVPKDNSVLLDLPLLHCHGGRALTRGGHPSQILHTGQSRVRTLPHSSHAAKQERFHAHSSPHKKWNPSHPSLPGPHGAPQSPADNFYSPLQYHVQLSALSLVHVRGSGPQACQPEHGNENSCRETNKQMPSLDIAEVEAVGNLDPFRCDQK